MVLQMLREGPVILRHDCGTNSAAALDDIAGSSYLKIQPRSGAADVARSY